MRTVAICAGVLVAGLALVPPAFAQSAPDPSRDGAIKGAVIGAAAGAGTMLVVYGALGDDIEAPAMGGMVAGTAAAGAGAGALIGYLLDKTHRRQSDKASGFGRFNTVAHLRQPAGPRHDSLVNGAVIGAAAGAGVGLIDYAVDPSEPGNASVTATASGLGALVGAGIDVLIHNDGAVSVAPALTSRTRALWVAVRF